MAKEVKLLAACGAGVNSSHQIKDAVEEARTQCSCRCCDD